MPQFPSKLDFVSFLKYSPDGESETSRQSRKVRDGLKKDGYIETTRVIDFTASRIAQELSNYPFLRALFEDDVTFVPVPRSSPLTKGALWPSKRISDALVAASLGRDVQTLVRRVVPVQVSHLAETGKRPEPGEHFASLEVPGDLGFDWQRKLVLVDDVVTRGSTMMGVYQCMRAAFPLASIRCFAVVRPLRGELDQIMEPVKGTISYRDGRLIREP